MTAPGILRCPLGAHVIKPQIETFYRAAHGQMEIGLYYRRVWYWDGEAKLRVEGNKMELTTIPAEEWDTMVKDAEEFWTEIAGTSPRAAKVVQIFQEYSKVMQKAGLPYRFYILSQGRGIF